MRLARMLAEMRKHPGGSALNLATLATVPTRELCAVGLAKNGGQKNVEAEKFPGDRVMEPLMNTHETLIERTPAEF
jgi:hypothetical protein